MCVARRKNDGIRAIKRISSLRINGVNGFFDILVCRREKQYEEIIDICDVFLNYQIVLPNSPCNFTSQIDGDLFDDQTPPDIPVVQSVTIDTLTGETQITETAIRAKCAGETYRTAHGQTR